MGCCSPEGNDYGQAGDGHLPENTTGEELVGHDFRPVGSGTSLYVPEPAGVGSEKIGRRTHTRTHEGAYCCQQTAVEVPRESEEFMC